MPLFIVSLGVYFIFYLRKENAFKIRVFEKTVEYHFYMVTNSG